MLYEVITVTGADDAPTSTVNNGTIVENDQLSTTTDTNLVGTFGGYDVDGDPLTYGITSGTTGGTTDIGGECNNFV